MNKSEKAILASISHVPSYECPIKSRKGHANGSRDRGAHGHRTRICFDLRLKDPE